MSNWVPNVLPAGINSQGKVVPGGHQVVVVDGLHEGGDLGLLGDLLLAHRLGDLLGVLVDASNDGVTVGASLGTVVAVLDDDGLPAGIPAVEDDHDLTGLEAALYHID